MTMIRPGSDVVYGIYRGLPSVITCDVVYGIYRGLPSGWLAEIGISLSGKKCTSFFKEGKGILVQNV